MELKEWLTVALGWLIAGPAFVAVFRAVGLTYRVRPSLPVGPQIHDPKDTRHPTSLPSRSGATGPVRPARQPGKARRPGVAIDERLWWDDGLGPVSESLPEAAAGD